jgi:hypothetical protein
MLIACKMEINYSKRDSSMMEFAAIDENVEVQTSQSNLSCSAGYCFQESR